MSSDECYVCGKKWEDHDGVVKICEELHRLRALTNELCIALVYPGMNREERFIRMGQIVTEIRNLNPEDFEEKVGKRCGLLP